MLSSVGRKIFCAISVGTNALRMTTVTKLAYPAWSMIPATGLITKSPQ